MLTNYPALLSEVLEDGVNREGVRPLPSSGSTTARRFSPLTAALCPRSASATCTPTGLGATSPFSKTKSPTDQQHDRLEEIA